MKITRVQHTCFVFETAEGKMAVDPALDYFGNLWSPRGKNRLASQILSDVTAVVITHSHCDHFHPPTFLHFDKQIPIVIPAADRESDFPMGKELTEYGFNNVIELDTGTSTRLAGLQITSVSAPDSIEGIVQQSLLINEGATRVLHGADTLEDFTMLENVRAQGPIRMALLPLNCSLNYQNIRNQMSPGTWLEAAAVLQPEAMVPLGVNEGQRRGVSALDAPWFPHTESLFRDRQLLAGLPQETHLLALDDGQSIVVDEAPLDARTPITTVAETPDSGAADIETALGRLWSILLDIHMRDRHYFGLVREMPHEAWRDAWLECRGRLEDLLPDWDTVVLNGVERLPTARANAPVLRWFPTTVRWLSARGDAPAQTVLDSLWLLDDSMSESDYAQALFSWLAAQVRSDATALWHCRLEYSGWLQQRQKRQRAALPNGFDPAAADDWFKRQAAADIRSAKHVYPRFHPAFGPFDTVEGTETAQPDPQNAPLALHSLRRLDGRLHSTVLRLRKTDAALARAIVQANGSATISVLCAETDVSLADYENFYLGLVAFAPYCLEHHWYPSQAMVWRPDFRA
ncbi:MBL fold metallo-hydrolase [Streptomyces sp. NPDC051320]|uniref:MBL fold metallo-hydrolase n=1 Tax=Streptomyces sp. NPDC051320 TaxID=3154644 RepID=UPI00342D6598